MEAICVQHALSDTRLRERGLHLMDDWNIRAHNEVARRFQESRNAEPTSAPPLPSKVRRSFTYLFNAPEGMADHRPDTCRNGSDRAFAPRRSRRVLKRRLTIILGTNGKTSAL